MSLGLTPPTGSTGQPVSTEIGLAVSGGKVTAVSVTGQGGAKVGGSLRDDGSSWVPSAPLDYGRAYTAKVTAAGDGGQVVTRTTAFRTMHQPARAIGSGLYLFDGVAMPVVVEFAPGIPAKDRAAVQRRMFVRTDPPQPGVVDCWHVGRL